jgi:hypothetical protein
MNIPFSPRPPLLSQRWSSRGNPRPLLRRAWATDRLLTLVGLAMLVTLAGTLVGLVVDHRVITGVPAWLKPAKFAISISIYSFTFLWLLGYIQGHPRLVRLAAVVTAIGFVAEMVVIAGQVLRGTTSHFNLATPLDGFLFERMRDFIIAVFLMNLLAGILLLRQRLTDPVFATALRLGLFISLIGMGVAILMVVPIPAQRPAFDAGFGGAHTIGLPDGGPGLPVVGWSTAGGDLRAPHFVGLHALQIMPLLGWLLSRRRFDALGVRGRLALVWTAGLTYLGLILILTWQALRGQPLIHPDPTTLTALVLLAAAAALVVLAVIIRSQRRASPIPSAV